MTSLGVALTAVLAVLLVVLAPRRAMANVAALRRDVADDPRARLRFYRKTVLSLPLVTALCFFVFAVGGEQWADAGATWDADARRLAFPASAVAVVGSIAVVAFLAPVVDRVWKGSVERAGAATKVLSPVTPAEKRWWLLVSLTAGVTEELVYRGLFVMHLHALVPSLPLAPLVVASAVAFGVAHRYQGPFGMLSSGILGMAFGVVAVVTGTVLVPVVLHTLWDVVAGFLKREVDGAAEPGRPSEAA